MDIVERTVLTLVCHHDFACLCSSSLSLKAIAKAYIIHIAKEKPLKRYNPIYQPNFITDEV